MQFMLGALMLVTSVFLVLLVLVQRGRGGGLSGAFGGMGGQSAFGTRAGDVFTKITIGVAAFWIILCLGSIAYLHKRPTLPSTGGGAGAPAGTSDVSGEDSGNDAAKSDTDDEK